MFLRVVILVFAATCCTARVIDVKELQSAWERSGKFEGDIMLTEEQLRTGLINRASRWPNRVVPYVIDSVFNNNDRNTILLAINDYHQKTAIRFKQYNPQTDSDYVHITGENSGCWSYVGRIGGRQQLNLQRNGCIWHGIVIHELLHALGFYHMQSATDRDNYVIINWDNIELGKEHNFNKYVASYITNFGVPYDYGSVMHYDPYAFSRNGLRTIQPRDVNAIIGQKDGFSAKDIERLARMYENSTLYETTTLYKTTTLSKTTTLHETTTLYKTTTLPETTTLYKTTTSYKTTTESGNSSHAMRSQFITLS